MCYNKFLEGEKMTDWYKIFNLTLYKKNGIITDKKVTSAYESKREKYLSYIGRHDTNSFPEHLFGNEEAIALTNGKYLEFLEQGYLKIRTEEDRLNYDKELQKERQKQEHEAMKLNILKVIKLVIAKGKVDIADKEGVKSEVIQLIIEALQRKKINERTNFDKLFDETYSEYIRELESQMKNTINKGLTIQQKAEIVNNQLVRENTELKAIIMDKGEWGKLSKSRNNELKPIIMDKGEWGKLSKRRNEFGEGRQNKRDYVNEYEKIVQVEVRYE